MGAVSCASSGDIILLGIGRASKISTSKHVGFDLYDPTLCCFFGLVGQRGYIGMTLKS
jgi:hypothetical protein